MDKQEMIKGIRETSFYDFISNNGYLLSKDELIFLAKEYNFAVYDLNPAICSEAEELLIGEINQNL